jgi:hypothetical protein
MVLTEGAYSEGAYRVGGYSKGAYTDKKENTIFLIYKRIQKGAVAKSYMNNGLLIYD